jgi:hypothetical protein
MPDFFLKTGLPGKNTFKNDLQCSGNNGKIRVNLSFGERIGDI